MGFYGEDFYIVSISWKQHCLLTC